MLGEEDRRQYPTLFVDVYDIVPTTIQTRPAGFIYSNNYMSLFVVFGIALQFGRMRGNRLEAGDVIVIAGVILCAAKLGVLALGLSLAWVFLVRRRSRWLSVKAGVVFAIMLTLYAILFPGVFAFHFDQAQWLLNFQLRFADLLLANGTSWGQDLAYRLLPVAILQRVSMESGSQSGYAALMRILPSFVPAALILGPLFLMGRRWLIRHAPDRANETIMMALAIGATLLVSSFLSSRLFWLFAGWAMLPIWVVIEPRFRALCLAVQPRKTATAASTTALEPVGATGANG
jgi:hypothetical protein